MWTTGVAGVLGNWAEAISKEGYFHQVEHSGSKKVNISEETSKLQLNQKPRQLNMGEIIMQKHENS